MRCPGLCMCRLCDSANAGALPAFLRRYKGTTIFLRCQIFGLQLGRFSAPIDTILCRACSHSAKLKFIWLCPRLTATLGRFSTDLFVISQHTDCQVCTNVQTVQAKKRQVGVAIIIYYELHSLIIIYII